MNAVKQALAETTNPERRQGTLRHMLRGADVFIGVSAPGLISAEDVTTMAGNAIVFALANPVPEILPDEVRDIARVVATGRSDYPNQINNSLVFPGLFRGALDVQARAINEAMKLAAAEAIAGLIHPGELHEEYIIPSMFDPRVVDAVAQAARDAAQATGAARKPAPTSAA
jgi:malate dehydrogenase (oxaloacetate-decarboxylating)